MKKETATARMFLFCILFSVGVMAVTHLVIPSGGKRVEISPRMWAYVSLGIVLFFSTGGLYLTMKKHALSLGMLLDQGFWKRNVKRIGVVVFVVVYIVSMEYLGYLLSSFVALTLLFYIFGHRRHVFNLLMSAGFILGTYCLFVEVFRISLPPFALL
jgi:putative tricarboxylic transport membrane protein